jgi:hypothetical protein
MSRPVRICSIVAAVVLVLTGCTGERAGDPSASAVRDAHSSVASLVLAVGLLLDGRATVAVTQVALEQCLEDVGTAQQELATSSDADPRRRSTASTAIASALQALVALGDRGADELDRGDLGRLEQVERDLAAVAKDLSA